MSLTPELLALSDNWCLPFYLGLTENSCFPSLSFLWHLCHCSRCAPEFVSRLRLQSYNVFSRCASVREKFFNIYVNLLRKPLTVSRIKICVIMLIYVNTIFHNYVAQQNQFTQPQKTYTFHTSEGRKIALFNHSSGQALHFSTLKRGSKRHGESQADC